MISHAAQLLTSLRAARERAGSILLGLDFDGTLAPIVPRPEDAALPAATARALDALARRADTHVALISGRGLADLRGRAPIDGAYYAGNHGLEIEGPGVLRVHEQADAARPRLAALATELAVALVPFAGAHVEDKGLTLSVHYRQVDDEDTAALVRSATDAVARSVAGVRVTHGRKVVEIRPDVDWHKGRALQFLRATLESRFGAAPAVFIGDDRTDEDAFRELGSDDFAILVGDPPRSDTHARAFLRDPSDVAAFLQGLLGQSDA